MYERDTCSQFLVGLFIFYSNRAATIAARERGSEQISEPNRA
jgi:hypothetical protein